MIDSAQKRASALLDELTIIPDGTISDEDRARLLLSYPYLWIKLDTRSFDLYIKNGPTISSEVAHGAHSDMELEGVGNSASWSHTCSGDSILMLVNVKWIFNGPGVNDGPISSSIDGAFSELISKTDVFPGAVVRIYYILNPSDGNHVISVVGDSGGSYFEMTEAFWQSFSFSGMNTSSPIVDYKILTGNGTSVSSGSLTQTSNGMSVDFLCSSGPEDLFGYAETSGQTYTVGGLPYPRVISSYRSSASSMSQSWSGGAVDYVYIVLELNPNVSLASNVGIIPLNIKRDETFNSYVVQNKSIDLEII